MTLQELIDRLESIKEKVGPDFNNLLVDDRHQGPHFATLTHVDVIGAFQIVFRSVQLPR